MRYRMAVRQHDAECALSIRSGERFGPSEPVLAELRQRQEEIESAFGGELDWVPGPRSQVRISVPGGGYHDIDEWATLHPILAETMARLVSALEPVVARLKTRPATGGFEDDEEEEAEE